MLFTLFHSGQAGVQTTTVYANKNYISDFQSLLQAVQFDHVAAEFKKNTRSTANFLHSDVVVMDIDNDHTENPTDWITAEMLEEIFDDYQFALATSRNHMLVKGTKAARPKYHIYFPIDSISDAKDYVALKEELVNRFGFFDDNAKDAARFFFGNPQAEVLWHDSWLTIDDILTSTAIDEEEDFDAEFYTPPSGPITQGSRNSTMSHFAGRVLKKYGISQEARDAFDEEAEKCVPPLANSELDRIWGSAVRFYNKTIKTSEGYIPPEEYNRGSLKPDDYSDIGEAGVLARKYGGRLAYTNATDYLTYTGKYWKEDKQLAVGSVLEFMDLQLEDATKQYEAAIKQLVGAGIAEKLVQEGGKSLAKAIKTPYQQKLHAVYLSAKNYYQFVMKRRDYRYIMATHNTAKPMLSIELSELDKDEFLLNTPEATYNLAMGLTGKQEHTATDYLTKVTTTSPSDKGNGLWQETLATLFCGDQELIDYVQMVVGMAAIGKVYQEHMIIAYGGGANGKSTFWNTIARVLGSYSGKLSADTLTMSNKRNVKPEMAELKGKRLIIASEMDEGMRLNTGLVKQLCSTDEIYAEKKYKDPFQFTPSHTLVLYTNHLPKVGANDDGIWRRLIVIPFNAMITGKSDVKNFADYLFEHAAPAIMAWIIEGSEKAIKADFKTKLPKVVRESVKAYREANDWLGHFIEECCEVVDGFKQKSGDLYSAYRAYASQNGEYIRSTTDFYTALATAGYQRQRTSKFNAVVGLKLLEEDFLD
ncbi:TPA: primase C-terminal domain-containing protein [Streptococcus suis]|nr:primase C-terminal domain-containing protein [Streptococcus suis]